MHESLCKSGNTGVSMRWNPLENIVYEFVLTSLCVSCLSYWNDSCDGRKAAILLDVAPRICLKQKVAMCYKQEGAISPLTGKPLKLIDQFLLPTLGYAIGILFGLVYLWEVLGHLHSLLTYLHCNISSTETDVNIQRRSWLILKGLSIIWKSDKIKRNFFHDVSLSVLLYGRTTWTQTKRMK